MLIKNRHIILWMLLCMCAQHTTELLSGLCQGGQLGVLRSRVATFDSLEVMNLRDGKLTYQLWKGTRLIGQRILCRLIG
jgi:hypothetical protein